MANDAWETAHGPFGEGPWRRAERMAWSLVKAMLGYDSADLDRIEAGGTAGIYEEESEIEHRWVPATQLLAPCGVPPAPWMSWSTTSLSTRLARSWNRAPMA